MTTFKISNDCHIKTCWSLKRRAILKIPRAIFLEEPIGYVGFKMKPLRKSFFQCGDKNQPKFCRKTSVYLMSHVSNICTLWYVIMEFDELNWICKHMKKVRSSQAAILLLNWVKTHLSLWVSLRKLMNHF